MRAVLADDSVLLREDLARLLTEAGFHVVGRAGDADEVLDLPATEHPDVAIVDIRMPPEADSGIRAAREISTKYRDVGFLVLSQYARPSYAFRLLGDGADGMGYLPKDRVGSVAELTEVLPESVAASPSSTPRSSRSSSDARAARTPRSGSSASANERCSH